MDKITLNLLAPYDPTTLTEATVEDIEKMISSVPFQQYLRRLFLLELIEAQEINLSEGNIPDMNISLVSYQRGILQIADRLITDIVKDTTDEE